MQHPDHPHPPRPESRRSALPWLIAASLSLLVVAVGTILVVRGELPLGGLLLRLQPGSSLPYPVGSAGALAPPRPPAPRTASPATWSW